VAENVIYKIRNLTNQKFYVGSAVDTRTRFRQHRKLLRRGLHHCKHLQASWNKYGEELFKFEVVEYVGSREMLEAAEDRWLCEHVGKPHCYNSGRSAKAPWRGTKGLGAHPSFGKKLSGSTKELIRRSALQQWASADPRTGKRHSEETKAKISARVQRALAEGRGGKFIPSPETRAKMSEALKGNQSAKGHVRTDEHRKKLSEANKGNQNWLGKTHSVESRVKMGLAAVVVFPSGERRQFATISLLREAFGLKPPTVNRALKSGQPLTKGPYKGWSFFYG
jgi:group I intron endonuclease